MVTNKGKTFKLKFNLLIQQTVKTFMKNKHKKINITIFS